MTSPGAGLHTGQSKQYPKRVKGECDEGKEFGKKDLLEMQDRQEKRRGKGRLRQPQAQAEAGIIKAKAFRQHSKRRNQVG